MRFGAFLLHVEGTRDATIEDLIEVHNLHSLGSNIFKPEGQKFLYVIETKIIDNRFFWFSCEYDDAASFREYVVDSETGERQPNPREKKQVEPRKQLFACFDANRKRLYISDFNKKNTLRNFLSHTVQKEFYIQNIYSSVDEFCDRIKTIKGYKFTQVDNLFSRQNDIFKAVIDYGLLDVPKELQLHVSYGDVPVHSGRALIDRLHQDKDKFEHVIIIGADDDGIEQTFDFSSVIERIDIKPTRDENEHYDPSEVESLLLARLR